MASFAGLRGTGKWGTDERPKSFRDGILWLNANGNAPLFALMAKARKQSLTDPEHSWWEEKLANARCTVNDNSGYSAGSLTWTIDATAFPISGGLELVAGDLLQVEPATEVASYTATEIVKVTSVTSDTVIVVERGVAGTSALGIADNTSLTRIGSAHVEGSTLPDQSTRNPTKLTNYAQIFRTVYGATNTALATTARTGDAYANDKKRKGFDHSNKIELAMLFGKASEDSTGLITRYMGGLREFITTNAKVYTTSPTEDDFLNTVSPVFDFTSESGAGDQRIMLCGNGFANNLNKVARNSASTRINFDGTLDLYGMHLKKYTLPQGELAVKTHPMMSQHARYTNSAFILDMSNIIYRPLRDTKFEDDVGVKGTDARNGQWVTEMSIEVQHEVTMAYIGNFVV